MENICLNVRCGDDEGICSADVSFPLHGVRAATWTCGQTSCDVTKTVTLRSGDMIWRYEDSRVESKIERQRITPACSRHTTSLTRKLHAARVFHTSFGARRGH